MHATTKSRRLEARIDPELDDLISRAAEATSSTKSAFVCEAVREAALKALSRTDVSWLAPEVFDDLMASLDQPDESPELEALVREPRQIDW